MGNSGITRRIDELGRLVIPKEIRNNLKIKNNDQVEINVVDNKIILNKYESLTKDRVINLFINLLKRNLKKTILFTSRNVVIDYALYDKSINYINLFDDYIMNIIENRQDVVNYVHRELFYNLFPLVINGDLYGSIIICGNDTISDKEIEIIKFSRMFLENYLE